MTTNHIFVFHSICPPQIFVPSNYNSVPLSICWPYVSIHFHASFCSNPSTYIYFISSFLFSCASYTCASPAVARQVSFFNLSSQFYLFDCSALSCLSSLTQATMSLRESFCESYEEDLLHLNIHQ